MLIDTAKESTKTICAPIFFPDFLNEPPPHPPNTLSPTPFPHPPPHLSASSGVKSSARAKIQNFAHMGVTTF